MTASPAARAAAFFDVDDTLVRGVTLFDFLTWWSPRVHPDGTHLRRLRDELAARRRAGRPRAELNRLLFGAYRGMRVEQVAELARTWWDERTAHGPVLHEATVGRFEGHRARGAAVVLVSGSFDACLAPLANELRPDAVLCSTPVVVAGRYTGDVVPLVGRAKSLAVARFCAHHTIDPARCHAYGDHESDLPVLEQVGHPVVLPGDPVLDRVALARGWSVLPMSGSGLPALRSTL